jgi:hypothetical protein
MNVVDLFWHIAHRASPKWQALVGLVPRWNTGDTVLIHRFCIRKCKNQTKAPKRSVNKANSRFF